MIESKCYITPKNRAYRKVKFEIVVTGGTACCGARRKRQER